VIVREDAPGDRRLVAYVVPDGKHAPDEEQLRRLLKATLPPFMVPSMLVTLQALPLSPNGKLDRAALPAPEGARPDLARGYAAPDGPVEQTLASIWSAVLGVDRVGVDDNFFDLGGHSMLAVRMLARVRDSVGLELELAQVFERPTIRELADALTERLLGEVSAGDLRSLMAELEGLQR
jgi:hypothetical protein